LPCVDERGALYLLDREGRLAGFDGAGRLLFHTSLGLRDRRRAIVLATGQVLAAGTRAGTGEIDLGEPSGVVVARRALPSPPAGLLPGGSYQGVLSLGPDGRLWRQQLPAPINFGGLTLGWGGAVIAIAEDERYLWEFAGGESGTSAYHPWPMPLGSPAAAGRP